MEYYFLFVDNCVKKRNINILKNFYLDICIYIYIYISYIVKKNKIIIIII